MLGKLFLFGWAFLRFLVLVLEPDTSVHTFFSHGLHVLILTLFPKDFSLILLGCIKSECIKSMSTLNIHWLSTGLCEVCGKLAFFIDKLKYWLTGDVLVRWKSPFDEPTRFFVISTSLVSFEVCFCVSLWLMVLFETKQAFLNLVGA